MSKHEKPSFVYVTYIATTPEKLWQALTDGTLTRQYWYGRRVESDWKVGSTVTFWYETEDGEAVSDRGIVLESKPPRRLSYTWHVEFVDDKDTLFLISKNARLIHFSTKDVPILSGPGKGVRGLKLVEAGDEVLGARKLSRPSDALRVINDHDREIAFGQQKYSVTSRGGKGVKTSQRTGIKSIVPPEIVLVDWEAVE